MPHPIAEPVAIGATAARVERRVRAGVAEGRRRRRVKGEQLVAPERHGHAQRLGVRHKGRLDQVVEALGHLKVEPWPHVGEHDLLEARDKPAALLGQALGLLGHLGPDVGPRGLPANFARHFLLQVVHALVAEREAVDKGVPVGLQVECAHLADEYRLEERVHRRHQAQVLDVDAVAAGGARAALGQPQVEELRDGGASRFVERHGALVEHPQVRAATAAVEAQELAKPKLRVQHALQ